MKKIFIIGSMSQISQIMAARDRLQEINYVVRIPNVTNPHLKDCVDECFKNIQWCDELLVIAKSDGTVGESVTHEICFAKYLHKEISYIY